MAPHEHVWVASAIDPPNVYCDDCGLSKHVYDNNLVDESVEIDKSEYIRLTALDHAVNLYVEATRVGGSFMHTDVVDTAKKFEEFLKGGTSEELTYREDTMFKARWAIEGLNVRGGALSSDDVTDILNQILNAGILFRERA